MEFFDWNKETASKGKTPPVAWHGIMCGPLIEPINWLRMASCDQPNLGFFLGFKFYHNLWWAWKTSKKVIVQKSWLANWIKLHILVRGWVTVWGAGGVQDVMFKLYHPRCKQEHRSNLPSQKYFAHVNTTFREKNTALKQKLGALLLEQKVLFPLQFDQQILHWSSQGW